MREEEVALREIERAKEEAEREERRFGDALEKARLQVESAEGAKATRSTSAEDRRARTTVVGGADEGRRKTIALLMAQRDSMSPRPVWPA
jgi:hypothetical protein